MPSTLRLPPVRVLIVPGLHDSGPVHWQSWLQARWRDALRVELPDWSQPSLDSWVERIEATLASQPEGPWVAVGHSFGCLALAAHLRRRGPQGAGGEPVGIAAALLVAPAQPEKFEGVRGEVDGRLGVPAAMLASRNDPWLSADEARTWSQTWQTGFVDLGEAGHVNAESGHGPLPPALHLTRFLIRHVEQSRRIARADVRELSFAV